MVPGSVILCIGRTGSFNVVSDCTSCIAVEIVVRLRPAKKKKRVGGVEIQNIFREHFFSLRAFLRRYVVP